MDQFVNFPCSAAINWLPIRQNQSISCLVGLAVAESFSLPILMMTYLTDGSVLHDTFRASMPDTDRGSAVWPTWCANPLIWTGCPAVPDSHLLVDWPDLTSHLRTLSQRTISGPPFHFFRSVNASANYRYLNYQMMIFEGWWLRVPKTNSNI